VVQDMTVVTGAGSSEELKRELLAFDDKVTKMERSMQQVYISLLSTFVIFLKKNFLLILE